MGAFAPPNTEALSYYKYIITFFTKKSMFNYKFLRSARFLQYFKVLYKNTKETDTLRVKMTNKTRRGAICHHAAPSALCSLRQRRTVQQVAQNSNVGAESNTGCVFGNVPEKAKTVHGNWYMFSHNCFYGFSDLTNFIKRYKVFWVFFVMLSAFLNPFFFFGG